tara:strand:+ start:90 stop:290 length:201 start_codon:yes stop_codon:yes gene_type:complete
MTLTREEKVALMVDDDIDMIREAMIEQDYEFLAAVLSGDGWVPYNQLTNEQVDAEFNEKEHLGVDA